MFNYRLKEIRKNLNMDAEDFASEFGIAKSSVYAYERGTNKPSYELLETLMQKLNINPNWLFTGTGEMFRKEKNTFEIKYEPYAEKLKSFGKRLNKLRVHSDMVTREMAMLLDIKEDRYSDLCVGKKEPTLAEIIKICENFEITADWLLFGKE